MQTLRGVFLSSFIFCANFCFGMTEADRANLVTQSDFTKTKEQFQKDIAKITSDIGVLKNKKEFTQEDKNQINTLATGLENLKKQFDTFDHKYNNDAKEKITRKEFNKFVNEFNTLKSEIEQLKNKPADIGTSQITSLENEIRAVKNNNTALNNAQKSNKSEIDDLKNSIIPIHDQVKNLTVIIKGKKGFKGLEEQFYEALKKINELDSGFTREIKKLEKIEDKFKNQESRLKSLEENEKNYVLRTEVYEQKELLCSNMTTEHKNLLERIEYLENILKITGAINLGIAISYGIYKISGYIKNKLQKNLFR